MDEPEWKSLKLSLERPYVDDHGKPVPALLDITADGQHIYEPFEDPSARLGKRLRQILSERGLDFFEKTDGPIHESHKKPDKGENMDQENEEKEEISDGPMNPDDLFKMRMELLPQLYIALGEMTHAKELISMLLSSNLPSLPIESPQTSALAATSVTKPAPIPSVQAFGAQLAIGGKDEALRKAAQLFKSAADGMETGRLKGQKYWVDALKIRRQNWGLVPAPLPYGSFLGKGADKTSKDFVVSFGLEESPALFRRRAVAYMPNYEDVLDNLVFPNRQHTHLRVSLRDTSINGNTVSHSNIIAEDEGSLDGSLKAAQREVVEQEIFSLLVKEAGTLPTACARVSERLIVIDAAQGLELRFELVDHNNSHLISPMGPDAHNCDLIYFCLLTLLLRIHSSNKTTRLGTTGVMRVPGNTAVPLSPPLLQPIIDMLQYLAFCKRVKLELNRMVRALNNASIQSSLRFEPVGEIGQELAEFFSEKNSKPLGGEAVLRVDERHTLRLTFLSPSSLTAHLSQATLKISSMTQLCQLLKDEVERWLLHRICEWGSEICQSVGGTWFVDLVASRSVGRWDGCALNFKVLFKGDFGLQCSVFRLSQGSGHREALLESHSFDDGIALASWAENMIKKSLPNV